MPEMRLTGEWQEAKAGLSMEDGESYLIEFHGPPDTRIRALDVEGTDPPASEDGAFAHFNRDLNPRSGEALEFEARAGWTWWLRAEGESTIVSAEI